MQYGPELDPMVWIWSLTSEKRKIVKLGLRNAEFQPNANNNIII